jgi:hypothetical protein
MARDIKHGRATVCGAPGRTWWVGLGGFEIHTKEDAELYAVKLNTVIERAIDATAKRVQTMMGESND